MLTRVEREAEENMHKIKNASFSEVLSVITLYIYNSSTMQSWCCTYPPMVGFTLSHMSGRTSPMYASLTTWYERCTYDAGRCRRSFSLIHLLKWIMHYLTILLSLLLLLLQCPAMLTSLNNRTCEHKQCQYLLYHIWSPCTATHLNYHII